MMTVPIVNALPTVNTARDMPAGLFVSSGGGFHRDRVATDWELIFVREGTLHIAENDQEFTVRSGESLLLWPGRRHRGTQPYPSSTSFYWLHFLVGNLPATQSAQVKEVLRVPQHTSVVRPNHLASLFRRYLDDQESGMLDTLEGSLLLTQMLCEVARPPGQNQQALGAAAVLAHRAYAVIHRRVSEPLSSADIAQELHCNPAYLARTFRQAYGETVTEAIHKTKLWFARNLLVEENETVDRVAQRSGFVSVVHFRRIFKRYEGMTPLAYRRLYGRTLINIR